MHPVALLKKVAARFMPVIEFCYDCGARQTLVWHADDALWEAVMGEDRGRIACAACFSARAIKRGVGLLMWRPEVDA